MQQKLKQGDKTKKVSQFAEEAKLKPRSSSFGFVVGNKSKIKTQSMFEDDEISIKYETQEENSRARKQYGNTHSQKLGKKDKKQMKKAEKLRKDGNRQPNSRTEIQNQFEDGLGYLNNYSGQSPENRESSRREEKYENSQRLKVHKREHNPSNNGNDFNQNLLQRMWKYGIDRLSEGLVDISTRTSRLQSMMEAASKSLVDSSLYLYQCANSLMVKQMIDPKDCEQPLSQWEKLQEVDLKIKELQNIKIQLESKLRKDSAKDENKKYSLPPTYLTTSFEKSKMAVKQQQNQKIFEKVDQKILKVASNQSIEKVDKISDDKTRKNIQTTQALRFQQNSASIRSRISQTVSQSSKQIKSMKGQLHQSYLKKLEAIQKDLQKNKKQSSQSRLEQNETGEVKKDKIVEASEKDESAQDHKELPVKHRTKSMTARYKKVLYQFSSVDKYLQIDVIDRDTASPMADDCKQKIVTLVPQLDHEYNRHKANFYILNTDYWVAVGICDVESMKKCRFYLKSREFGAHGVYMMSSGGITYSNFRQTDHRTTNGFLFNTGDIVSVVIDSSNHTITFMKGKGNDMSKLTMEIDPALQLSKIRFCVGLGKTKDLVSIKNLKEEQF